MGLQYWQQLSAEHGIAVDGTPSPVVNTEAMFEIEGESTNKVFDRNDRPELFFNLSDSNKFTPRAILIDLETSVVGKCTNALPMFNQRNIHLSEQGNGAANNWQHGYTYGSQHEEELLSIIDREADKCDNIGNFQLIHSVAGGTGSGVGSLLLELLSDRYGSKKLINTFLVFPSNEKTSDVVVQPYNTMLTMKRLIEYSDCTFVFDNDSLNTIENALSMRGNNAFEGANKLIAQIMASISNPLRFPNYMYSSFESILSTLVPTPDLKFISTSFAPSNLNEYDLILELLNDRYKMNRVNEQVKYITLLNYLIGTSLNQQEIRKATLRAQQRVDFVPWASSSIHIMNGLSSPYLNEKLKGIQLSNNTSIATVFGNIVRQYELLAKREAYINFYTETNNREEKQAVLLMFNECKESVTNVINEYKNCQSENYLDDDILQDDVIM